MQHPVTRFARRAATAAYVLAAAGCALELPGATDARAVNPAAPGDPEGGAVVGGGSGDPLGAPEGAPEPAPAPGSAAADAPVTAAPEADRCPDEAATCPQVALPDAAAAAVTVTQAAGAPPALAGGPAPSGRYELRQITVYLAHAAPLAAPALRVADRGTSRGAALFCDGSLALQLQLDLQLSLLARTVPLSETLFGGGAFRLEEGALATDLLACADGHQAPGMTLPPRYAYHVAGDALLLELRLPPAAVRGLLAVESPIPVELGLANDLVIHLGFTRAAPR